MMKLTMNKVIRYFIVSTFLLSVNGSDKLISRLSNQRILSPKLILESINNVAIDAPEKHKTINTGDSGCVDNGGNEKCALQGRDPWICVDDETAEEKYRCICQPGYKQDGTNCIRKTGCADYGGHEECSKKGQDWNCEDDLSVEKMYICICSMGYAMENEICVRKQCSEEQKKLCNEDEQQQCILSTNNETPECICKPGYENTYIEDILVCKKKFCSEQQNESCSAMDHQKCVISNVTDQAECVCTAGYEKDPENYLLCRRKQCSRIELVRCVAATHQQCIISNVTDEFKCICKPGYESSHNHPYDLMCKEIVTSTLESSSNADEFTIMTRERSTYTIDFNRTTIQYLSSKAPECDCGLQSKSCKLDNLGNKECLCFFGFSQLGDICTDCYCGQHSGGCYFDVRKHKICLCQTGYAQRNQTCSETCTNHYGCLNNGICVADSKSDKFCECPRNFSGDRCEVDVACKSLEASCKSFGAICKVRSGEARCECPPGKAINTDNGYCEYACNENTCVHGSCEIFGKNYMCKCDEGYTGMHCEREIVTKRFHSGLTVLIIVAVALVVLAVLAICITIICRVSRKKTLV